MYALGFVVAAHLCRRRGEHILSSKVRTVLLTHAAARYRLGAARPPETAALTFQV
jgi:hypothetical protein